MWIIGLLLERRCQDWRLAILHLIWHFQDLVTPAMMRPDSLQPSLALTGIVLCLRLVDWAIDSVVGSGEDGAEAAHWQVARCLIAALLQGSRRGIFKLNNFLTSPLSSGSFSNIREQ